MPNHSDLIAALFLIMEAFITALIPWIQTPELMTLVFFMHGIPPGGRLPGKNCVV